MKCVEKLFCNKFIHYINTLLLLDIVFKYKLRFIQGVIIK